MPVHVLEVVEQYPYGIHIISCKLKIYTPSPLNIFANVTNTTAGQHPLIALSQTVPLKIICTNGNLELV